MGYTVRTDVYEGPFDILLDLILRQEVDLYEVSLSTIVDAYLAELDRMQGCDLDVATEFLLIAAILIELKTRRLLPVEESIDLDDEFGVWEERDLLLSRLLECKTFKDAARALESLALSADRSIPRRAGLDEAFLALAPDLLAGVTGEDLRQAFVRATTPRPVPTVSLDHVNPITVTVADTVAVLLAELPRGKPVSFRSLTVSLVDRIEVVIHFLAVLELYKQGVVDVEQVRTFGDIEIRWIGGDDAVAAVLGSVENYEG